MTEHDDKAHNFAEGDDVGVYVLDYSKNLQVKQLQNLHNAKQPQDAKQPRQSDQRKATGIART